jgi:tRNA dimethylallyltransferase
MSSSPLPPLVIILGPTAVGKTEVSLQLAERLKGEIVSADSRLLYRGMDIGTAKPSPEEMSRIRHHLIDVAEPDEVWSLAVYQAEAVRVINQIHQQGRLPILVGGTGQYLRAFVQEWEIPKVEPNPALRQALEEWAAEVGVSALYERMKALDPEAAESIEVNNLRRTVRALEVIFSTGRRFSEQRRQLAPRYHTLQIGLTRPRQQLYARVDERIDAMLRAGFVEEVQDLLEHGYSPDLPSLSAIGYREITAYLHGEYDLEEAVRRIKKATRVFVRRQANWFKASDPDIHWFDLTIHSIDTIENLIRTEFNFFTPID